MATTYSVPAGTGSSWSDTDLSTICTDAGGWEYQSLGPYTISSVADDVLFNVTYTFELSVSTSEETIALSNMEIRCDPIIPTQLSTTAIPATSVPTTNLPTAHEPTPHPTTYPPSTAVPTFTLTHSATTDSPITDVPATTSKPDLLTTISHTTINPTSFPIPSTTYSITTNPETSQEGTLFNDDGRGGKDDDNTMLMIMIFIFSSFFLIFIVIIIIWKTYKYRILIRYKSEQKSLSKPMTPKTPKLDIVASNSFTVTNIQLQISNPVPTYTTTTSSIISIECNNSKERNLSFENKVMDTICDDAEGEGIENENEINDKRMSEGPHQTAENMKNMKNM
eukprot:137402_1